MRTIATTQVAIPSTCKIKLVNGDRNTPLNNKTHFLSTKTRYYLAHGNRRTHYVLHAMAANSITLSELLQLCSHSGCGEQLRSWPTTHSFAPCICCDCKACSAMERNSDVLLQPATYPRIQGCRATPGITQCQKQPDLIFCPIPVFTPSLFRPGRAHC